MKRAYLLFLLLLVILFLAGCAASPNEAVNTPTSDGNVADFPMGLWHGMISPVTLVISCFKSEVGVYEAHNNGGWYNLGFILGIAVVLSGIASSSKL